MADTAYRIPNFVAAKTLTGLRRAMLLNNAKKQTEFLYHDIQNVNGQWIAWFHDMARDMLRDEADGST